MAEQDDKQTGRKAVTWSPTKNSPISEQKPHSASIPRIRSSSFSEYQDAIRLRKYLSPDDTLSSSLIPPLDSSPIFLRSSMRRTRSTRYDVAGTMDRLRSSLIGGGGGPHTALDDSFSNVELLPSHDPLPPVADGGEAEINDEGMTFPSPTITKPGVVSASAPLPTKKSVASRVLSHIPAIVLIGMFHMMIGIPFGVSYFPIGWKGAESSTSNVDDDSVSGSFPIPGKEALGIRMFLFSTAIGQIVFTLTSGFNNPIGLQMVENVPFCHALSQIVIRHQGYGTDALATLFVMFGLSSIIVGAVFYTLGHFGLGRVVYYFPTHVLVGMIGGIGLFLSKTSVEVTIDDEFGWESVTENIHLLAPVLFFELLLRILERVTLDADGKPRFSLLSPIYFCLITPVFYTVLLVFQIDTANAAEYFFPSLLEDCGDSPCSSNVWKSIFNEDLLDMWKVIDFSVVSWSAIANATPTLLSLTLFSLIHVPINIPAFAISTNTEADMNKELVAHGISNVAAGIFGGLQNYMAYTQSVLYDKSGGRGKGSGFAVAILTGLLFFVGPTIASYIPKCMAGTLLLHVGIDLFLEGVYDSYGKFDMLEYAGIWLIVVVMTLAGMDAAMIAGGISAVSTYVVQSIHYVKPIRGSMSAATLRSSRWYLTNKARTILDDDQIGRNRILVIQLQGHLFFGNMAQLTDSIHRLLSEKARSDLSPWVVILDFSLVLGIDSSAAQTLAKLKNVLHKSFSVDLCIFVSGSDQGFPCEFDLSKELNSLNQNVAAAAVFNGDVEANPDERTLLVTKPPATQNQSYSGSRVEESLDTALIFAEDALLARQGISGHVVSAISSSFDEKDIALRYLKNLCPGEAETGNVELLLSYFAREIYEKDDIVWKQGSSGDCVKLLVQGTLISVLENEAGTSETIARGNTLGELGMLLGIQRMSSVYCLSDDAVVYSMSREAFDRLTRLAPHAARLVDLICIRYLSSRVQHVSNRIFETRCLPI